MSCQIGTASIVVSPMTVNYHALMDGSLWIASTFEDDNQGLDSTVLDICIKMNLAYYHRLNRPDLIEKISSPDIKVHRVSISYESIPAKKIVGLQDFYLNRSLQSVLSNKAFPLKPLFDRIGLYFDPSVLEPYSKQFGIGINDGEFLIQSDGIEWFLKNHPEKTIAYMIDQGYDLSCFLPSLK